MKSINIDLIGAASAVVSLVVCIVIVMVLAIRTPSIDFTTHPDLSPGGSGFKTEVVIPNMGFGEWVIENPRPETTFVDGTAHLHVPDLSDEGDWSWEKKELSGDDLAWLEHILPVLQVMVPLIESDVRKLIARK